jgi:hypothetical protein
VRVITWAAELYSGLRWVQATGLVSDVGMVRAPTFFPGRRSAIRSIHGAGEPGASAGCAVGEEPAVHRPCRSAIAVGIGARRLVFNRLSCRSLSPSPSCRRRRQDGPGAVRRRPTDRRCRVPILVIRSGQTRNCVLSARRRQVLRLHIVRANRLQAIRVAGDIVDILLPGRCGNRSACCRPRCTQRTAFVLGSDGRR